MTHLCFRTHSLCRSPLFCLFPTDINFSLTFRWPSLWEVTLTGADGLLWLKWVGSSLFISLPVSSDALLWSFAPQFMSFHYISFCFDGCSCTPASPQTSCLPLSASGVNEWKTLHYSTSAMHFNRKLPTYLGVGGGLLSTVPFKAFQDLPAPAGFDTWCQIITQSLT